MVVESPRVVSSSVTSKVSQSRKISYSTACSFILLESRDIAFFNFAYKLPLSTKDYEEVDFITNSKWRLIIKLLKYNNKVIWSVFCNLCSVNQNEERRMSSQKQYKQMPCQPAISSHAQQRMDLRGMSERDIELVLKFGRKIHSRRTVFHVIGRKEIKKYAGECPELKELDGLHVLTVPQKGTVLTAYRNHDLRHIRPSKRKHKHLH
ncbi:DUF4258 domain-containing protein [Rheinheimera gaetbuli]